MPGGEGHCPNTSPRRLGVPFRRHSEISIPGYAWRWALREDRDSLAACDGSICRHGGNRMRDAGIGGTVNADRGDSVARGDLSCIVFDKDRHVCDVRILGHAARSAYRCEHAARTDLSCARGQRILVPRRPVGTKTKQV